VLLALRELVDCGENLKVAGHLPEAHVCAVFFLRKKVFYDSSIDGHCTLSGSVSRSVIHASWFVWLLP